MRGLEPRFSKYLTVKYIIIIIIKTEKINKASALLSVSLLRMKMFDALTAGKTNKILVSGR